MATRVTSSMLTNNYLRNVKRNLNNMKSLQNQLSSGNKIQKASENPYIASRTMQLNSGISYNKQYDENIKDTSNWLDTTDTALSQIGNVFGRIQTLLVNAGNGSYSNDERTAIQDEIKEKVNELSQILNTNFDGSYIFGGTKTNSKPTTVVNGVLQYANSDGNMISTYLDAGGAVTSDSVSTNTLLAQSASIYLDQGGKITTSATSTNGTANTQIIQGSSLYVDTSSGTAYTSKSSSVSAGATANPLILKDELYIDLNGNITPSKTTDNTLITSDNELLYLTSDGKVTTTYNSAYTLISTGTPLYKGANGQVMTTGAAGNQINQAVPIYKDAKGFVTTSSITVNTTLTAASVNALNVSKYDPTTGYTTSSIDPSCNVYMDSRGILTNSSTTDLSKREARLKDLWTSSYIDPTNQQVKTATPIPSHSNQINLYKDANGLVTTSPGAYPANEQILLGTTNLYKTSDGKVTTVAGAGTTQIQLTDAVYVDLNGKLTTSASVANNSVSVRDTLSISTTGTHALAKASINPVSSPDTVIPSDSITLFTDGAGNITNDGTVANATKIVLSDSLYRDSYDNITTFANTQNKLINSDDKLYKDANGNVTNSASNIAIISGTTLYKDSTGMVTTLQGSAPPNEAIDLKNAVLYKDANGNVTTNASLGGVTNTLVDHTTSFYKDVNGNVTVAANNTQIDSSTQLYKTVDGKSITTDPVGSLSNTTQLYKDGTGNVTTTAGAGRTPMSVPISANSLYMDTSGKVTTSAGTPPTNTPIPSGTKLYDDGTGQVRTRIVSTGDPLYADTNGKIITAKTTSNTILTASDNIYVDAAKNLTMSAITANKKLTMSDVINLKTEYDAAGTTSTRKTQINAILNDKNVAQLSQLDSDLKVDISQGVKTKYNETAVGILEFKDKNGKSINVSDLLSNIITDLGSGGNTNNLTTTELTDIQSVTANLLQRRSEVGSMQNRMDSAQQNNEAQNYDMTDILSKTYDIDFAETTMDYSTMQTVYTASLQTSAKILPMSILNYL
ncbi:flagellar hook-associated protein FlgL [Clostridium beijerinckii]|uniref:flagellar hook-associated protein FlgL n=1 Tax=Clostridium beijerinckii TaxID=1520 RepID=UPI0004797055|nr:flagellar hook-associated protein FlgL [Clostridium beijerinckii]